MEFAICAGHGDGAMTEAFHWPNQSSTPGPMVSFDDQMRLQQIEDRLSNIERKLEDIQSALERLAK